MTDGSGNKTTYTYWPSGQVRTKVDPRGNVAGADASKFTTSYTYDAQGHVFTTTDANDNITTKHYDPVGNLDWSEDGKHQRTIYQYDNASQLTDSIDPSGADNHTDYLPGGLVKDTVDPFGHMTSYTYDAANRVHPVVSARGNLPKTDPNYADPSAFTTTYEYDGNDQPVRSCGPPDRDPEWYRSHHPIRLRRRRKQDQHCRPTRIPARKRARRLHHHLRVRR